MPRRPRAAPSAGATYRKAEQPKDEAGDAVTRDNWMKPKVHVGETQRRRSGRPRCGMP